MGINHAVVAVGYGTDGTDYFNIRNSWGIGWGESGYIRLGQNGGSQGTACLYQYAPVTPTLSSGPLPAYDTCAEFGCGTHNDFRRCNCNINGYGTRCSDFQALCVHDKCAEIGCNNFDDPIPRTCTCDPSCDFYTTCCPDYGTTCHG